MIVFHYWRGITASNTTETRPETWTDHRLDSQKSMNLLWEHVRLDCNKLPVYMVGIEQIEKTSDFFLIVKLLSLK